LSDVPILYATTVQNKRFYVTPQWGWGGGGEGNFDFVQLVLLEVTGYNVPLILEIWVPLDFELRCILKTCHDLRQASNWDSPL